MSAPDHVVTCTIIIVIYIKGLNCKGFGQIYVRTSNLGLIGLKCDGVLYSNTFAGLFVIDRFGLALSAQTARWL